MIRVVLLVLLLVGCAERVWVKPGGTQEEFTKTKITCKQTAAQMTSALAPGNIFILADQFNECMTEHGWALQDKAE